VHTPEPNERRGSEFLEDKLALTIDINQASVFKVLLSKTITGDMGGVSLRVFIREQQVTIPATRDSRHLEYE
jgi:hypothetical protein